MIKHMWNAHRKVLMISISLALFLFILVLPEPDPIQTQSGTLVELSREGKASLAVLAFAIVLWVSEALPFPVAGLLAVTLLAFTRVGKFTALVKEGFGNEIILFLIGVMVFSSALGSCGLLQRVNRLLISRFGHNPRVLLFAFLSVGAVVSMWISDMAVAAMLTPIGAGILSNARLKKQQSNFGRALMIACAWGPLIGGIGTPAGAAPNPIAIGYLKDLAGIDFGFLEWMLLGVPAMVLMVPGAWLILLWCFPLEPVMLAQDSGQAGSSPTRFGKLTRKEIATLIVLGLAVLLWTCESFIGQWSNGKLDYFSISFVALFTSLLLFMPGIRVLTWEEASRGMEWGAIILVMTGLCLGTAAYKTGAVQWVSAAAFLKLGAVHPVGQVFLIVTGVSLIKVMFSSNTLTGIITVPLMIALAKQIDAHPALLAIPAGITASLSFILVTSAPACVIPYTAGYFSIKDMAKAGLLMTLVSALCVTISIALLGSFCGIKVFGG